jgi:SAM-dependent methyltransferase
MAFVLYEETGEKKYLKVAKGALDWMTHQDFRKVKPITFQQRPSGIIFYCFELYATGLKYLKPGSQQYERAIRQIDLALDWMAKNQKTRGANVPDYVVRNVDMAGLPYLMYAFARQLPQHRGLTGPADCELRYIGDLLLRNGTPNVSCLMVWEVMTWGMMSYAERLSPGAMHRSSKRLRGVPAPKPPAVADKETSVIAFERTLAAADLVALKQRCGAAETLEESLQLVRRYAFSGRRSGAVQILAFEENRLFIYALADISGGRDLEGFVGSQNSMRRIRRFFLLKPSIIVVEDLVRAPGAERPVRWLLRSAAEPKIEGTQIRVVEADVEILGESLLPADASLKTSSCSGGSNRPMEFRVEVAPKQASDEVRFLHVFDLGRTAGQGGRARSTVTKGDKQMELTITAYEQVFRLTLPYESSSAGKIEVVTTNGRTLLPSRLLPSGILPHGPEGARLLERWDAPYRRDRLPGWDVGQPCSHLVKALEDEAFRPGRVIVLGCGSGTNAIYLASKGFEVTGVDVAPSALTIAEKKERKAGVKVNWMVADILALPKLEAFDLVFDRGCYHHICQYNSAGYVKTLRRLSHGDTRVLILAGSDVDGRRGGPPRVKEETIRNDFSKLFEFEWLRGIRFDTRNASANGASAWSIHLRRKDE